MGATEVAPPQGLQCFKCGTPVAAGAPGVRRLRVAKSPLVGHAGGDVLAYSRRSRWGYFCAACLAAAPAGQKELAEWSMGLGAEKGVVCEAPPPPGS